MVDHCLQLHCKMCEITVLVTVANCGRIRGAEKGKSELTMTVETFDLENHENVEKVKLKPISFFGGIGWFWEKFSQSLSCEDGYKVKVYIYEIRM